MGSARYQDNSNSFIDNRSKYDLCRVCLRRYEYHNNPEWANLVGLCEEFKPISITISIGIRLKAKTISNFIEYLNSNLIPIPIKGSRYWWRLYERYISL